MDVLGALSVEELCEEKVSFLSALRSRPNKVLYAYMKLIRRLAESRIVLPTKYQPTSSLGRLLVEALVAPRTRWLMWEHIDRLSPPSWSWWLMLPLVAMVDLGAIISGVESRPQLRGTVGEVAEWRSGSGQ